MDTQTVESKRKRKEGKGGRAVIKKKRIGRGIGLGWYSGLNNGPQKICPNSNPQNLWMWLYLEKKVFADVIKLSILRWDHPGLPRWALNSMTTVCIREQNRHRRKDNVTTEDENGVIWQQVNSYPKMEEAKRDSPLEPPEGVLLWQNVDFRHLASRTMSE